MEKSVGAFCGPESCLQRTSPYVAKMSIGASGVAHKGVFSVFILPTTSCRACLGMQRANVHCVFMRLQRVKGFSQRLQPLAFTHQNA